MVCHTKKMSQSFAFRRLEEKKPIVVSGLYKTQLCEKYPNCPYGLKCQFAHGKEELRVPVRHKRIRKNVVKEEHIAFQVFNALHL